MKRYKQGAAFLLIMSGFLFTTCTNNSSRQQPPPKDYGVVNPDDAKADTVCYEHTQGLSNKDVATISLYINKADVNGDMIWAPSGKYSSIGTLSGNKKDSMISTMWAFTRQGKPDTLKIKFKLINNKLYQQPFNVNSKTGTLSVDSAAACSVEYHQVDCIRHQ